MRDAAKQILWPVKGVETERAYHDIVQAEAQRTYSAPFAVNVRTECTLEGRRRGGSRPGLKRLTGVVAETGGAWRWPNGDAVAWPDGTPIGFALPTAKYTGPDGAPFVNPHQPYTPAASKGAVPSGVRAMAWYRYRLFVAKDAQWYASRSGDVTDWDYGGDREDVARAATGSVAMAGIVGETITAMMPVGDTMLYIATERALWRLTGEPTNGTCQRVMDGVGCVGPNAWCVDSGGGLWWISSKGVFRVTPGEAPMLFTSALPDLRGTDANALMAFDHDADGVHLFSTTDGDWFLDIDGKAAWPVSVPLAIRPTAAAHVVVGHRNVTALLGADGRWRYFDDDQTADDRQVDQSGNVTAAGTAIASRVALGPFRISADDAHDGFLAELHAATAQGSADVAATLYTGRTAEEAVKLAKTGGGSCTFSFVGGFNAVWRPRVRGAWCVAVISSTGRWAYESLLAVIRHTGRLRP